MSLAYIPVPITGLASGKPEGGRSRLGSHQHPYQVGSAVGLAAMTAVATGIIGTASDAASVTDGYQGAFLGAAVVALIAAAAAAVAIARPQVGAVFRRAGPNPRGSYARSARLSGESRA